MQITSRIQWITLQTGREESIMLTEKGGQAINDIWASGFYISNNPK